MFLIFEWEYAKEVKSESTQAPPVITSLYYMG